MCRLDAARVARYNADMGYAYTVIGSGRQGVALAYDLAQNGEADRILLVDQDPASAAAAVARLAALLPERRASFAADQLDAADVTAATALLRGSQAAISAAPYRYNVGLCDAAIAAGASFCDLGGNTAVVRAELARHAQALARGVSVVPDCGLAPGLGNHLAAHGIAALDEPLDVHVRCGGLPELPVGPLGYKLLFHFQGLINEYSGHGEFIRDGRPIEIPALTELETLTWEGFGQLEAAVTSGGTSTCPTTYLGRLRAYDYKTIRYPGHFAMIRALFELGCFEEEVRLSSGAVIQPKALLRQLLEERLRFPAVRDVVLLRVEVTGRHGGAPCTLRYELTDRHDNATGFTAMERTTAFPAALVAYMQARGDIAPGAQPLEVCVPAQRYVDELPRHDIHVRMARA